MSDPKNPYLEGYTDDGEAGDSNPFFEERTEEKGEFASDDGAGETSFAPPIVVCPPTEIAPIKATSEPLPPLPNTVEELREETQSRAMGTLDKLLGNLPNGLRIIVLSLILGASGVGVATQAKLVGPPLLQALNDISDIVGNKQAGDVQNANIVDADKKPEITSAEFARLLKAARDEAKPVNGSLGDNPQSDPEYQKLPPKDKAFIDKLLELYELESKVTLGSFNGDIQFTFRPLSHGNNIRFARNAALETIAITIGTQPPIRLDLKLGITQAISEHRGPNGEKTEDALDYVIAGLKEVLAATKPVYRTVNSSSSIELNDAKGRQLCSIPASDVQTLGIVNSSGNIFVLAYGREDGKLISGWVREEGLGQTVPSFEDSKKSMKVTDKADKMGGLALRSDHNTNAQELGKRIPVGTELNVEREETSNGGRWAYVSYTDPSGATKTGWACISTGHLVYMKAD